MYKHLSRPSSRTLSGHVCLSCRRNFHAATTQRNNGGADDWLANFNDLSIESETIRPSQPKFENPRDADKNDGKKRAKLDDEGQANSFEELKQKLNFSANSRGLNAAIEKGRRLEDASSNALEGIPRSRESSGHVSQDVRQTYESVLDSLLAETEQKQGNLRDHSNVDAENPTSDLDSLLTETETEREAATRANHADNQPSLLRKHRSDSTLRSTRRYGSTVELDHNGQFTPRDDRSSATSPVVDDIDVGGGIISKKAKTPESSPEDLTGKPMSIATKARVVRERPKWGGMSEDSESPARAFKASFDTLQRADKVSKPKARPATAASAKPWGFKSHDAGSGFASSPGDLADASATPKSDGADSAPAGSFRGMQGFARLRNMLYGSSAENGSGSSAQTKHAEESVDPPSDRITQTGGDGEVAGIPNDAAAEKEEQNDLPESQFARSDAFGEHDPSPQQDSPPVAALPRRSTATLRRQRARANRRERDRALRAQLGEEEPSDTPSQSYEDAGRSLSESMVGRQLSDAMGSAQEAELGSEGEEYIEYDSAPSLPIIEAKSLRIKTLNIAQPPVPGLAYGLDRTLFNPGVVSLQDQHSRVYNFDPYLQHIMPVEEFDFNALQQYKTSSQDSMLSEIAKANDKKYVGSTSSMTSTLSHFHYLLSGWRDLNLGMLSRQFPEERATFTAINRAPTAIFLRWKNGTYGIDADKEHDSGNILMMLGKSMEKLLTISRSDYERYRKSDPRVVTEEERNAPEAYEYTTMGDFLMRSQLDAYDSRLPGTGMFDIKTRAIASIRMSTSDYKPMLGYEIVSQQGKWESYEREYYDMMRSTMLKYMLQARMGRMDGIFLAYHNVQRMFGFQYMPIAEIDRAIHGQIDRCLGDQEFKLSLDLLNKVLEQATAKFPEKSLRLHFETRAVPVTAMYIFAEPMEEDEIDKIQATSKEKIAEFERKMMGIEAREEPKQTPATSSEATTTPHQDAPAPSDSDSTHAPLYAATILIGSQVNGERVERPSHLKPDDEWSVEYLLKEMENPADAWATYAQCKQKRKTTFSRAVMTDDEGGAEAAEDVAEPNMEMHEGDGSLRTFENFYLESLRQMAEKGREMRREIDEVEKRDGKVVYGEKEKVDGEVEKDVSNENAASQAEADVEAGINGVEDYMTWMYKDHKQ